MSDPELAVVVPTYNEARNVVAMADALLALPLALQLIIVDDNSPDGTGDLADQLAAKDPDRIQVIHRPQKNGLGRAYKQGFQQALRGDVPLIAQMDCDFSHSPDYLPTMVETLRTTRADVIIGSRYVPGGELDEDWSWWREALSQWANFYARAILRLRVRDATAGFKLWRREVLAAIDLERVISNGYVFQVEMAYLTQKLGFLPIELPIFFEDRRIGRSKMDIPVKVEAAWRVLELLWRYRKVKRTTQNEERKTATQSR
ncbi:MAG: polyprenol monophosphomannose synthase [Anaerolineales bacterium]|nr:polyprenol monophosphomannose synthase [Anaerolineales bacterium]